MKNFIFLLLPILFFQCKGDDDSTPEFLEPTISVQSVNDLREPVLVGATLTLNASLRTDESVGIKEVVVTRFGEEIHTETDFDLAAVGFSYDYKVTEQDFLESPIEIDFLLFDNEGNSVKGGVSFDVTIEFIYYKDLSNWETTRFDLVENEFVEDGTFGLPADLELLLETQSCGTDCEETRMTLTTDLGTVLYALPSNDVITPLNLELKQFDVINSIMGYPGLDELVVYSDFSEDVSGGQPINRFPFVARIRGTDEFAVFDFDETTKTMFYRKRSAGAGVE